MLEEGRKNKRKKEKLAYLNSKTIDSLHRSFLSWAISEKVGKFNKLITVKESKY